MSNYTAADMIGLTIFSRLRVPRFRWNDLNGEVLGYIEPGKRIGVIRSWINRKPGSDVWFWEFEDRSRGELATFYVPHIPELLDMPKLREDLESRDEALRRRQLEWYERFVEDTGTVVNNVAQQTGNQLVTGGLLLGGLYLVSRLLKNDD